MVRKQCDGEGLPAANFLQISKNQPYEIISQMKTLIDKNPEQARQIFIQYPPLTKAVFQVGSSHLGPEDSSHAESSRASKGETSMDAWLWELSTARMGKAVGPLAAHH
ncbi:uncharacterized protein LOC127792803 isoform X1 [Diospyros lotus]|uniref:uncharacterized protein LOC127792803 isoform X1 n=1 Tax=Diospyros lotus TaxID=55363 RepID=UPI00225AA5CA|nr:uncharacterized protein LOC127792803 isoform X1 [Diospyros lotus]XP_052179353.1 uncharacterized protein LOC127792803 isoform X1 [Diospyros lotus]XP_052179354.1 uncharacterized protein LOC127792803 isoform X1 [Diospyros lotus]XP_052179355.1 uncharacterized protein LOC127792803 isoform X1 [Diospyros lotus]XP_052179356.1 uncharacterized protein LOC127792803 isoform X1 [Diospyros lotus]XP_052179357.1 uncharacterized protein LOC127792803 isoform X1 [Diospyros lotus]XP_052179358.1 uncharacterize